MNSRNEQVFPLLILYQLMSSKLFVTSHFEDTPKGLACLKSEIYNQNTARHFTTAIIVT